MLQINLAKAVSKMRSIAEKHAAVLPVVQKNIAASIIIAVFMHLFTHLALLQIIHNQNAIAEKHTPISTVKNILL